jgi:hypothetical protein
MLDLKLNYMVILSHHGTDEAANKGNAIRLALINRGELEEADAQNAKREPLWAKMEADIKTRQNKLDANLEKRNT